MKRKYPNHRIGIKRFKPFVKQKKKSSKRHRIQIIGIVINIVMAILTALLFYVAYNQSDDARKKFRRLNEPLFI